MGEDGTLVVLGKVETHEDKVHDALVVVGACDDFCHGEKDGALLELDATLPELPSLAGGPLCEGRVGGDVPADDFSALGGAEGVAGGDRGEPVDVLVWGCGDDPVPAVGGVVDGSDGTGSADPPRPLKVGCPVDGVDELVDGEIRETLEADEGQSATATEESVGEVAIDGSGGRKLAKSPAGLGVGEHNDDDDEQQRFSYPL